MRLHSLCMSHKKVAMLKWVNLVLYNFYAACKCVCYLEPKSFKIYFQIIQRDDSIQR